MSKKYENEIKKLEKDLLIALRNKEELEQELSKYTNGEIDIFEAFEYLQHENKELKKKLENIKDAYTDRELDIIGLTKELEIERKNLSNASDREDDALDELERYKKGMKVIIDYFNNTDDWSVEEENEFDDTLREFGLIE